MAPLPFPRTSRSLSADHSRYALGVFAVAAAALVGWGLWAWLVRVEVEVQVVVARPRATSPGSEPRPHLPPAVRIELDNISPAAWLLFPVDDGAGRSPAAR